MIASATWVKSTALRLCLSLALFTLTAPLGHAALLINGSFEDIGTQTNSFSFNLNPNLANWTAAPGNSSQILNCVMRSNETTNLCGTTAFGGGFSFWQNPGPSPDGGNFLGVDGDSNFATPFSQTVNGLTVGASYTLSFYQAAGQQFGFNGATTERWQVTFGGDTQLSTLMNNAEHGKVDWNQQSLTFVANSASQVLTFFAVGTPGGAPPFVLLDGVTLTENVPPPPSVPEPTTTLLIGLGLAGIPVVRRFRK